jgi:hypothetical protein
LNIGGGSKVAGGLGALAAGVNAFRIAIDLKQSMGEAGAQLMQEYVNATGGPGGYVQTTANQAGYVWDPNATSDTPGFIEPGKNFRLSTGEYLYYTNEFDVSLQLGIVDLERPLKIASTRKVKNWLTELSLSDVGHFALDILGTLPIMGPAADLIHAGWYFFEGDYKNAALSAAASIGGSSFLLTSKYGSKTNSIAAKFSDEVASEIKLLPQFASSTIDEAATLTMKQKELHIFSNRLHSKPWLKQLSQDMGGNENVIKAALENANGRILPNAYGIFNTSVNVGGIEFTIRGKIVNGIPIINSIFIPS